VTDKQTTGAGGTGSTSPKSAAEIASSLRLRPERPPVTRLSRKVLAGGTALALVLTSGAVLWALQQNRTRFTLFANDGRKMADGAKKAGLRLDGPHQALLIQGDDEAGALADIYQKLSEAGIQQQESSGIANIEGRYGVVLYLTPEDCEKAVAALTT